MSINKKTQNPCCQKTIGFLCKAGGGENGAQGPFRVKKLIIDRPYFAFMMMRNFDLTAWEPDSPATRINIPPWVTHTGCVVFFTGFCWALSPSIDIFLAPGVMFLPRAGVREGLYPPPPVHWTHSSLPGWLPPHGTAPVVAATHSVRTAVSVVVAALSPAHWAEPVPRKLHPRQVTRGIPSTSFEKIFRFFQRCVVLRVEFFVWVIENFLPSC